MPASSSKRRARRTRSAAGNGNGSGRTRARQSVTAKSFRGLAATTAPASAMTVQSAAEMDRSDPQFKAALKSFGAATRFFHKQNFKKAQELFEEVVGSPARELAERARVHLVLCEQKLGRPAPAPKTAGEYYDLGVAELNARNLDLAIEYLNKADKSAPNHEHIKYALAAAHAVQRNADVALEHLKAAIALRPGNRFQVRLDEDFQPLASDPRFKRLIHAEAEQNF